MATEKLPPSRTVKAIFFPSGDQFGSVFVAWPVVMSRPVPPLAAMR